MKDAPAAVAKASDKDPKKGNKIEKSFNPKARDWVEFVEYVSLIERQRGIFPHKLRRF